MSEFLTIDFPIVLGTDDKTPSKRGYYTKAQQRFKPFIKDQIKLPPRGGDGEQIEDANSNPLAEKAELISHQSCLAVATVSLPPQVNICDLKKYHDEHFIRFCHLSLHYEFSTKM